MEHEKEFTARFSTSNHRNLWIRTQEHYPQIGNLEFNDVVVGILIPNRNQKNAWFCQTEIYLSDKKNLLPIYIGEWVKGPTEPAARTSRQREICAFLGVEKELVKFA